MTCWTTPGPKGLAARQSSRRVNAYQALIEELGRVSLRGRTGRALLDLLRGGAEDSSWLIRDLVADALGVYGVQRDAPLLRQLLCDRHEMVRCSAIRAIGQVLQARAYPVVVRTLKTDESRLVRSYAAIALQHDVPIRSLEEVSAIADASDEEVQWELAYALWLHGERGLFVRLLREAGALDEVRVHPVLNTIEDMVCHGLQSSVKEETARLLKRVIANKGLQKPGRAKARRLLEAL